MIARTVMLFIALAASTALAPSPAPPCSHETLSVQGSPLSIAYCIAGALRADGAAEVIVPVTVTYTARGGTAQRSANLHFLAGEGVSRVLQSIELGPVGLTGTLHLTLDYVRGVVRVEGALLTPGAITIK